MPNEKNRIFKFRVKKSATEYAFDPEGSGYDYNAAAAAGIEPDSTGHYPSRVPETGQILKGMQHETINKTIAAERKLGFEIKKGPDGKYYSNKPEEPGFVDKALSAAGTFLTKPLYQSDEILGEAGEEFKKAFTKQSTGSVGSDIEKGLSHLAGGVGKTIEAPIAALLGYVNQIVEPVATAAAESSVGKAIDETPTAQFINQLLTKPATTAMQGVEDLTGLKKPDEGFLQLGDLLANLLGFKAAEAAIFPKTPNLSPFGDVKISKARLKELKSEGKIKETSKVSTEQSKSAVKQTEGKTEVRTEKPKGPDQKVTPEAGYTKDQITGLKAKTLGQMAEKITLNSPKLGKFRNDSMGTVEVFKQLKEKGLFEEAKAIAEDLTKGSKFDVVKGATLETVSRVMLKEAEALKGKVAEAPKPKVEPRPAADIIIETPVAELPKPISNKIIDVAEGFKAELEGASVTRKQAYGNEYLGIGQTKSFTVNTFPEWFRRLGRDSKDVIAALDKIIDGKVTEKGTLVKDLKAEIMNRLEGKHEESIISIVSGKKKVEKMGDIPADAEFVDLMNRFKDKKITPEELGKGLKEIESETSFKPGVDFEAGPEVKFATPVKDLKAYNEFKSGLKDRKMTNEELVNEMMDLDGIRNKQKPSENPYGFRQLKDLGNKLGEQTGKDVIVDAKNIWVDGQKVTGKQDLLDFVKPAKKPEPVKMTAEGAARKAAAEGKEIPKVETPKTEAKPKNVYEALRESDSYTVKDIAAATKEAPKKIANMISDLVANKMINKVTDAKGNISWKPTEEFKVLLDDMVDKPKQYQTDLGTLYSNPIPQILKGLSNAQTFLDDAFKKLLGDRIYQGLGKGLDKIIPEKIKEQVITNYGLPKEYTTLKQYAKDAIERYNELAKEIGENLKYKDLENKVKFSEAEQVRLGQIIKGSITKNPVFKERATQAIKEIKQLETLGKQLEVLPLETYNTKLPRRRINELLTKKRRLITTAEKIKDLDPARYKQLQRQIGELDNKVKTSFKHGGEGYFKRVYLSKEQQTQFARYGYYRPTRLDLTSALHRKDIPFEVRKQMGEVLQASYPVSKGIVLEGKDVSLGNFFKSVSEHPDWVSSVEREGFTKMQNSKKLGKLADMWVENRIAADINDVIKLTSPEHFDSFLRGVNSIWKATKTIMNPSTHFRNVMSNSVMLDFSGVPHLEQVRILPDAIKAIRGKGKYAREFEASRLNTTTFAKEELGKFLDVVSETGSLADLGKMTTAEKALKIYGKASGVDTKLGNFLGKIYQMEETVGKAVKFISEREKGKSILEARAEANKWLFDYGEIPKAVEFLRTNPLIGKPFVTWSYKAFPRIIEAAITRPVSFWKYPVIFSALTKYALKQLDMTEEEWERLKADFPERLARGEWLLLPFRDENGRMQQLDLTYILPYKDVYDVAMQGYALATTGEMEQGKNIAESVVNMIDSPVTTMISEIGSNKNSYTGFPIYSTADSPGEKYAKVADYMYKLYMPSLVPEIPGISEGGYSYHKLASTIKQKEDYYGRNFTLGPAFMSAFMGVKTTPIDPQKNRERKYYKLNAQLMEFSKKRSRIKKDPTINGKDKEKQIREIEIEMSKLKAEQKKTGFKP